MLKAIQPHMIAAFFHSGISILHYASCILRRRASEKPFRDISGTALLKKCQQIPKRQAQHDSDSCCAASCC